MSSLINGVRFDFFSQSRVCFTFVASTLHSLFDVTLRLIFSGKFVCRYALIRDVTLNYFEKYSDVTLITVKKIYKCVTDVTLLTVQKIYHFLDL